MNGGFGTAMAPNHRQFSSDTWELLKAVAEDIKLPLLEISQTAELAQITGQLPAESLLSIQQEARLALGLVDSYMLGLQIVEDQRTLDLEPTALSSVLYDTAHDLTYFAKPHGIRIESQIIGNQSLVMAHQSGLRAALLNIGKVIISAQPSKEGVSELKLVVHQSERGIITGIYRDIVPLPPQALRRACQLYGKARQPLSWLSDGSAAGIFIASNIIKAMSGRLRTSHHGKQAGLAVVLQPSHQLQLV
jgi:K+-sensing histidine kinase KdpD